AIELLEKSFDHFSKKHYSKLLTKHDISEDELRDAIDVIEHLNPKPGGTFSGNTRMAEHVIPDFTIKIVDGELELSLNGCNATDMHISKVYRNMSKCHKASR